MISNPTFAKFPVLQEIETPVNLSKDCVRTPYSLLSTGYGSYKIGARTYTHHRVVYCAAKGVSLDSIKGLVVRHTCHNRWCVNPEHLVIGTYKDNAQDMLNAGRDKHGTNGGGVRKLDDLQVAAIRTDMRNPKYIAKEYKVSKQTIINVQQHKSCYKD